MLKHNCQHRFDLFCGAHSAMQNYKKKHTCAFFLSLRAAHFAATAFPAAPWAAVGQPLGRCRAVPRPGFGLQLFYSSSVLHRTTVE